MMTDHEPLWAFAFAVSVDEDPSPAGSAGTIFPPGGLSGMSNGWQNTAGAYATDRSSGDRGVLHPPIMNVLELIVAEVSHVQCDVGVHAWDQLDYPTVARCKRCGRLAGELDGGYWEDPDWEDPEKPQVCCELYVDTGHHEPDCPEFFQHMMSEP